MHRPLSLSRARRRPGAVRDHSAAVPSDWASAAGADITPGTQTYIKGAVQCTTNFDFVDDAGDVYVGQAAHCASTGESDETNGCKAGSLPLGTPPEGELRPAGHDASVLHS